MIRSRRGLLKISLVLLCAAFLTNESRADAPAGLRTGPAAWVEEYRDDTSIDFGSFFNNTCTIITYRETPPGAKLLEIMQKNGEALGSKGDRIARVTKVPFPHALNPWDMQYRAIETSLVPLP